MVVSDDFDRGHVHELGHDPMLGQRRDALERLIISSSLPVGLQLRTMKRGPLAHGLSARSGNDPASIWSVSIAIDASSPA